MSETSAAHQWLEPPAGDAGDAIVAAMAAGGVDHLFFTSGTEIGFYQEAIARARALGHTAPRLVTVTHEYVCLNAALGYSALSGRPAATAAHVDVGTQHYGCAIHSAWYSGLPVLITAGAPPASYPGSLRGSRDGAHLWGQQTYDQNGIVRQYMKWEHRLEYQDNPGLMVSRALQVALSEPCGPAYLSLPRELVFMPAREGGFPSARQLGIARAAAPDAGGIEEIAAQLLRAENPCVVAGTGRDPQAVPALVELCELLGMGAFEMPVRAYQCFPMDHPLYQGAASPRDADAVLLLDVLVPWVPGPAAPGRNAYIAVVDTDPVKLKIPSYEFTANLRLQADPLLAIGALCARARELMTGDDRKRIEARSARWREAAAGRRAAVEAEARSHESDSPIHPNWLSLQIAELLDDNSVLIDDTTHNRLTPYLKMSRPGSYFHNPGSSGGWGPGAAFGAKLAAPDRDVICVTGDGFYMFGVANAANWAAARHGAPFMTVIFQNRSYATGTSGVAAAYPEGYAARSGFEGGYFDPPIDFAREAEAAGAYGENVRDPGDIAAALRRGLAHVRAGKPAVIAVWLARILQRD